MSAGDDDWAPTDDEVQLVAAELAVNSRFITSTNFSKTLDFSDMQVSDAGAASLAAALETNTTLQQLDLGYNKVGAAARYRRLATPEKNTTLQKLYLTATR